MKSQSSGAPLPTSFQFFRLDQIEDIELWNNHRYTTHQLGPKHGGGQVVQDFGRDRVTRCRITFRMGPTAWIEEVGYISNEDAVWLMQNFADFQRERGRRPGLAV